MTGNIDMDNKTKQHLISLANRYAALESDPLFTWRSHQAYMRGAIAAYELATRPSEDDFYNNMFKDDKIEELESLCAAQAKELLWAKGMLEQMKDLLEAPTSVNYHDICDKEDWKKALLSDLKAGPK